MTEYSKVITTLNGQSLMAKMIAGAGNIEFTKVCTSSATYTEEQLTSLTVLNDVQQTSAISKVERTNDTAIKIETAFTNNDLTDGYYMRTLGLYAMDPDEDEILYAACIATSDNCYMPAYNGITVTGVCINMYQTVGNASNVSLDVDSGAFATISQINEIKDKIAVIHKWEMIDKFKVNDLECHTFQCNDLEKYNEILFLLKDINNHPVQSLVVPMSDFLNSALWKVYLGDWLNQSDRGIVDVWTEKYLGIYDKLYIQWYDTRYSVTIFIR